jgi:hypothetical protein
MITFGARLFTLEIIDGNGKVWDTVTVKADRVSDAARAMGDYLGMQIVWVR